MQEPAKPGMVVANAACFASMFLWSLSFPLLELLLDTWGSISLTAIRYIPALAALLILWVCLDGFSALSKAPWLRGLYVGGLGFGVGGMLLLTGQRYSDPVTPAIAVATMPVVGAVLEVVLDNRRLNIRLILGIVLALGGGYMATGVSLAQGSFGYGTMMCLLAVVLFAWSTRATTRNFPTLSPIGQTTVTFIGATVVVYVIYGLALLAGLPENRFGRFDGESIALIVFIAVASIAAAQALWIWGAGGLGILLASFHMNAVPFYVMVIAVILLGSIWNWEQAGGAALVAAGVILSQARTRRN